MTALVYEIIKIIAVALIILGLLIDIISMSLFLRWNRKGYGASGIPGISIVLYAIGIGVSELFFKRLTYPFLYFILLLGVHIFLQYIIPFLDNYIVNIWRNNLGEWVEILNDDTKDIRVRINALYRIEALAKKNGKNKDEVVVMLIDKLEKCKNKDILMEVISILSDFNEKRVVRALLNYIKKNQNIENSYLSRKVVDVLKEKNDDEVKRELNKIIKNS